LSLLQNAFAGKAYSDRHDLFPVKAFSPYFKDRRQTPWIFTRPVRFIDTTGPFPLPGIHFCLQIKTVFRLSFNILLF
jgi:hypothetical protein